MVQAKLKLRYSRQKLASNDKKDLVEAARQVETTEPVMVQANKGYGNPGMTVQKEAFTLTEPTGNQQQYVVMPEIDTVAPVAYGIATGIGRSVSPAPSGIRFFDLFAGIGGFRMGLERLGWKCVGFCEFNKYCVETYKANYDTRGEFYHSDATTIDTAKMPDFDVLVGGFPCQAFSLAGHRKGFEDTRGTLFFEAARIIKDKQPKAFILENVKGLTLMSRNTNKFKSQGKLVLESKEFDRIIEVLRMELGYQVFFKVLNSKNFGVPQNRERVFIVGFRPDIKIDFPGFQYPEGEPTRLRLKDILEPSVPERYYIQGKNVVSTVKGRPNIYPSGYVSGVVSSLEDLSRTLFPGESGGSIPHVEESGTIDGKDNQTNRVYSEQGLSPTHTPSGGHIAPKIIVAEGKLDGRERNALSPEGVSKTVLDGHGFQVPKIQVVEKGEHQQHNVYSSEGISPSLVRGGGSDTNKKGGGVSQRFAPKIEVIGEPHFGKTEISAEGISPTVRDNHGDSPARIEVEGEIYSRGGNVLSAEGLSETVRAADSNGGRVKIVDHIPKYGNQEGNVHDTTGLAPTVKSGSDSKYGSRPVLVEDKTEIAMLDHTKANIRQRVQERDTTWTVGSTHMGVIEKVGEIAPDKGTEKKREQGWSLYSAEGISPTVMAGMGEGGGNVPMLPTPQKRIRRLTPRECLRLQGFPDTFKVVCSDTQAYKQAGNAVTTTVITAVGQAIEKYLK